MTVSPDSPRPEWLMCEDFEGADCIEMMMKINTPGASDGEMAFWIDDELAHSESASCR